MNTVQHKLKAAHTLLREKKLQQSLNTFQDVLKLDPQNADALYHVGMFAQKAKNFEAAEKYMLASLQQNPKQPHVHFDLAVFYQRVGDNVKALRHSTLAYQLEPNNPSCRYAFTTIVRSVRYGQLNEQMFQLLSQVIAQDAVEADRLFGVWHSLFRHTEIYEALLKLSGTNLWRMEDGMWLTHPAILLLLSHMLVQEPKLELALTEIRRKILMEWPLAEVPQPFIAALAIQNFRNEYVWMETAVEAEAVQKLAKKASHGEVSLPELLLLGSYRSLSRIPNIQASEKVLTENAKEIWRTLVKEPLEEEAIKPMIEVMTPIENSVSQDVQAQYEENPYPRWQRFNMSQRTTFAANLKMTFPHLPDTFFAEIPTKQKVLFAGCGSGKQVATGMAPFTGHQAVAVDLSKTSLAYAIRKMRELKLDENVRFGQADILKLEEAFEPESFDIIHCTGVLHHMQDPMAGWRVLTKLLKPKGLMWVALYSQTARTQLNVLREEIKQEGIPSTADAIRNYRSALLAKDKDKDKVGWIVNSLDFYSMSACRDLLFHVQEHQFTIPQIQSALAELGLEFIGFIDNNSDLNLQFKSMFPNAQGSGTLEEWHAFEQANPLRFAGMYQFWVQKKP